MFLNKIQCKVELLDLSAILKAKNPKLARILPKFVVRWIEKLLRVKRHNHILAHFGDKEAIEFIDSSLDYIDVRYELYGVENIPEGSKILFAANHPLGGIDGMILATAVNSLRPDVKLIVNDILLNIEPLRPLFVGVNKHGAQSGKLSEQLHELYNSDSPIINFAAGMCSRKIKGEIIDLPWKSNFVQRSMNSGRTIVPTYVDAHNSKFFYRFANFRKWIGIKANLEMMLLPREVFYQEGKVVRIYFGEAITPDKTKSARGWSDYVREKVYKLKTK